MILLGEKRIDAIELSKLEMIRFRKLSASTSQGKGASINGAISQTRIICNRSRFQIDVESLEAHNCESFASFKSTFVIISVVF